MVARLDRTRICRVFACSMLVCLITFSAGIELPSSFSSAFTAQIGNSANYVDRGLSMNAPSDTITLSLLLSLTGGQESVPAFEEVIQQYFIQYGVRQVLLDIGWQNYTAGSVPFEQWVSDWLTACDALGITNQLYVGQFTKTGIGSPWVNSLLQSDPTTRTFYSNGTAADYISLDNPDVVRAVESDLAQIYDYYGTHPSWTGLSTGASSTNDPYYSGNVTSSTMPVIGYSNYSIESFANSPFFNRDVNQTGYDQNGALDSIWASFRNISNATTLSSGVLAISTPVSLFGNATRQTRLAMLFYLPSPVSGLHIAWYGSRVGNPGQLWTAVFADVNGTPGPAPIAQVNVSSNSVSSSSVWQPPISYNGTFSSGYYWMVFSCNLTSSKDYYNVYIRNYFGSSTPAESASWPGGVWIGRGASTLWVKDANGSDISVYPFFTTSTPPPTESFVAPSSFSFNTILLFLQSRYNNETNATLSVTDVSTNRLVATANLSQIGLHGLENWVPIQLNGTVHAVAGHTYLLSLVQQRNDHSWQNSIRGLLVNPPQGGFQNQSLYWLFQLAMMTSSGPSHFDYQGSSTISLGGANVSSSIAMSFVPKYNESLSSLSLLMSNPNTPLSNYNSSQLGLSVSLQTSNGTVPSGVVLRSLRIPGLAVPQNGWLNVSGFNQPLSAGTPYWIVLSANGTNFSFGSFANPYQTFLLQSNDNGKTWRNPAEGPSDLSFHLTLSQETIGNTNIVGLSTFLIGGASEFAQPVIPSASIQVQGVYLGPLQRQSRSLAGDHIIVSINPDDGNNKPSGVEIASGVLYGNNLTLQSSEYVQFSSVARLNSGEKYWIVIQGDGGTYSILQAEYSITHGPGGTALESNDGGFSWTGSSGGNGTTDMITYELISPLSPLPDLSTSEAYNTLQTFHSYSTASGQLQGWNAYLQYSELNALGEIADWFSLRANRSFTFSTTAVPNVLNNSGQSRIELLPQTTQISNCTQLAEYMLAVMPMSNLQYYPSSNLELLHNCRTPNFSEMGQMLNLIPYFGNPIPVNSTVTLLGVNDTALTSPSPLVYGVYGNNSGPFLVWLSNPSAQTLTNDMRFNFTGFGLKMPWHVISLSNMMTANGNSSIISLHITVPPLSWEPLYISGGGAQLSISYSNLILVRQLIYPNQALYAVSAVPNQSGVLVLPSSGPAESVLLNDNISLSRVTSISHLSNLTQGWYFDSQSQSIVIKYQSSGNDMVRVITNLPPSQPASAPPFLSTTFGLRSLLVIVAVFANGLVIVYLKLTRRK
ncbi:MAG TPA: hypothetical protein VFF30_10985 [Nitrososphaerales archaeon]|nr:hypothetical protein [Nitrososphaerales archaeon]